MPQPGPDYTILSTVRTPLSDVQVLIRLAGGQQVKVTVPKASATPEGIQAGVDAAILHITPPPGPDT